jgi:hypothetical protein
VVITRVILITQGVVASQLNSRASLLPLTKNSGYFKMFSSVKDAIVDSLPVFSLNPAGI